MADNMEDMILSLSPLDLAVVDYKKIIEDNRLQIEEVTNCQFFLHDSPYVSYPNGISISCCWSFFVKWIYGSQLEFFWFVYHKYIE